jgi:hypothetical protein
MVVNLNSNLRTIHHRGMGSVAQLDRATAFEAVGRGFESLRARHGKLYFKLI